MPVNILAAFRQSLARYLDLTRDDKTRAEAITSKGNGAADLRPAQDEEDPPWTIENTKLIDFHPSGLEVDTEDTGEEIENPYLANPFEQVSLADEPNRPWHEYKFGTKYFLPNDQVELSRLDRQHIIWRSLLDGLLLKAPIGQAKHVLDVGTGSGVWATEFAQENPESKVLGIDLSLPSPPNVPANCEFLQRDFMDPWDYSHQFDYIHARLIFVAQSDPRRLLQSAYDALAPGGYVEFHELYGLPMDVGDGSLRGRVTEQFFFDSAVASRRLGNDILTIPCWRGWMADVGFEDIVEERLTLPVNPWPRGRHLKALGAMQTANPTAGMGAIYTRMLMKGLGWGSEETAATIARVREDIQDRNLHAYFPVYVVYGRKPL